MLGTAHSWLTSAGMVFLMTACSSAAPQKSGAPPPARAAAGKKHVIHLENTHVQSAGVATFELPLDWADESTYQYQSPDHAGKLTLLFDSSVKEADAQAIVSDRIEESKLILPGFRLEQRGPVALAGRSGEMATFVAQDADQVTRTCVLVVMIGPARALIAMAQGPANRWREFDPVWQRFVSSLQLTTY